MRSRIPERARRDAERPEASSFRVVSEPKSFNNGRIQAILLYRCIAVAPENGASGGFGGLCAGAVATVMVGFRFI